MSGRMGSAVMEMHGRPGFQHGCAVRQDLYAHIDARCGRKHPRVGEPIAPFDGTLFHAGDIQCTTFAGATYIGGSVLRVDAAHTHWDVGGKDNNVIPNANGTGEYRACHDGPMPGQREYPVDREAKQSRVSVGIASDRGAIRRGSQAGVCREPWGSEFVTSRIADREG